MNELQKKEFELLKKFDDVCKQLDLKYFLVCGTALGAEKYGGFIPWDDDIDVGLLREDYEKFIMEAQKLFPNEFFIQNYKTDPKFPYPYSKLRNSNTTYIEKTVMNLDMNHGIYIDIFPLDGYPSKRIEKIKFEIKKYIYKLQIACVYNGEFNIKTKLFFLIERLLGFQNKTRQIVAKLDKLYSQYSISESDLICNHGNWQGKIEYAPKNQYGQGKFVQFEGLEVLIPEKIDEYLTQKYGKWKNELPEEQKVGHHYYWICDLNKSYREYTNKQE